MTPCAVYPRPSTYVPLARCYGQKLEKRLLLEEKQNRSISYTARWRVRSYELDSNGHVNNAVYLAYAEEVAVLHAESLGFGRPWTLAQGGAWVVRKHEIVYHRPARFGDDLELTTTLLSMRGARGVRQTRIALVGDALLAEVTTEWVWVRASDGRPQRVPDELRAAFEQPNA